MQQAIQLGNIAPSLLTPVVCGQRVGVYTACGYSHRQTERTCWIQNTKTERKLTWPTPRLGRRVSGLLSCLPSPSSRSHRGGGLREEAPTTRRSGRARPRKGRRWRDEKPLSRGGFAASEGAARRRRQLSSHCSVPLLHSLFSSRFPFLFLSPVWSGSPTTLGKGHGKDEGEEPSSAELAMAGAPASGVLRGAGVGVSRPRTVPAAGPGVLFSAEPHAQA